MKRLYLPALFACMIFGSCQELEDASPGERTTFMHFYEGAYSMSAAGAEVTDDGFIIAGTVDVTGGSRDSRIIVIKTDKLGKKQWQTTINNGIASSLKVIPGGYAIIGSAVTYSPNASDISELENHTARLIILNDGGTVINDLTSYERVSPEAKHVDYIGNGATLDGNENLVTLGTFRAPGQSSYAYVASINLITLDTVWSREYNYIVRDYVNTRSIHADGDRIVWGSSITESINAFSYSYLAIPVVAPNSTFLNSNYYGQNDQQQSLKIRDLRKTPSGYAAVGTYSKPDGKNADILFIKIDRHGRFEEGSVRYFDGLTGSSTAPSLSDLTEAGEAVTTTRDGGFAIAGTLTTDEGKGIGNGGKDLWLIKTDAFGNMEWNRIIGGSTSETVSTIRETDDGGLLICGTIYDGTEQSGGLSSIFLMKTDRNGELKD